MSRGNMAQGKTYPKVEFEKDTTEFIPYDEPQSPARSSTSSEFFFGGKGAFLDEIALVKRHMIPRQATLKNRKMGVVLSQQEKSRSAPISLEELKGRGIRMENGEVVYNLPSSVKGSSAEASGRSPRTSIKSGSAENSSRDTSTARSPAASARSSASAISRVSMFEPAESQQVYNVGQPGENARLAVIKLKNGERYELMQNKRMTSLEITKQHSILISFKE